jgi:hypothetical protein
MRRIITAGTRTQPSKRWLAALTIALAFVPTLLAQQAPTSRTIFFNGVQTTLPPSGTQDLVVQLWDDPAAGNPVFSESQPAVADDANSTISFVFGSQTGGGLSPTLFPSPSSRYLDVTDTNGTSILTGGRVQLTASPFALNPGPQGSPGVVQTVTAADSSVAVSGTPADRVVAVAANGITNGHVATGALSPSKIAGTAATLGPNSFSGNQSITGSLATSGSVTAYNGLSVLNGFAFIEGASNRLAVGDIGCGAGIGVILPFGCGNYAFLGQPNGNTFINSSGAGQIHFRHDNLGADQVTLLPGGNVGIATTAPIGKLHVVAPSDFAAGYFEGNVLITGKTAINTGFTYALTLPNNNGPDGWGIANAWQTWSSVRYKENVRPIDHALEKVERLQGVYYDNKSDKKKSLGVIAEEVGKVLPEIVDYEENGKDARSVDYTRLTAVLIEAVKEQQTEIRQLKSEVERLHAHVNGEAASVLAPGK